MIADVSQPTLPSGRGQPDDDAIAALLGAALQVHQSSIPLGYISQ